MVNLGGSSFQNYPCAYLVTALGDCILGGDRTMLCYLGKYIKGCLTYISMVKKKSVGQQSEIPAIKNVSRKCNRDILWDNFKNE